MASWGLNGYVAQLCLLGYVMLDFTGFEHPVATLQTMSRCLVGNGTCLGDLSLKPRFRYTIEANRHKHHHDIITCKHELKQANETVGCNTSTRMCAMIVWQHNNPGQMRRTARWWHHEDWMDTYHDCNYLGMSCWIWRDLNIRLHP